MHHCLHNQTAWDCQLIDLFSPFADVKNACVQHQVSLDTCTQLLSVARPVALSAASAKSKGFQSTAAIPHAEGGLDASQPPSSSSQPDRARVAWDLYQYAVSVGFDLTHPAIEGLWESQVCEGAGLHLKCLPGCLLVLTCLVHM